MSDGEWRVPNDEQDGNSDEVQDNDANMNEGLYPELGASLNGIAIDNAQGGDLQGYQQANSENSSQQPIPLAVNEIIQSMNRNLEIDRIRLDNELRSRNDHSQRNVPSTFDGSDSSLEPHRPDRAPLLDPTSPLRRAVFSLITRRRTRSGSAVHAEARRMCEGLADYRNQDLAYNKRRLIRQLRREEFARLPEGHFSSAFDSVRSNAQREVPERSIPELPEPTPDDSRIQDRENSDLDVRRRFPVRRRSISMEHDPFRTRESVSQLAQSIHALNERYRRKLDGPISETSCSSVLEGGCQKPEKSLKMSLNCPESSRAVNPASSKKSAATQTPRNIEVRAQNSSTGDGIPDRNSTTSIATLCEADCASSSSQATSQKVKLSKFPLSDHDETSISSSVSSSSEKNLIKSFMTASCSSNAGTAGSSTHLNTPDDMKSEGNSTNASTPDEMRLDHSPVGSTSNLSASNLSTAGTISPDQEEMEYDEHESSSIARSRKRAHSGDSDVNSRKKAKK